MYKLRYYQEDASRAAQDNKNGIIVLPTGAGKSLVIADIVNKADTKVIILQPSKEILEQNFKKIKDFGYEDAKIYSASLKTKELGKATFATIGSVMNKKELFQEFKTIIIDEAHLVNAKGGQYLELIQYLQPDKIIGLTATPYRLHTNSFGSQIKLLTRTRPKIFKDLIHVTQTKELIDNGYLISPTFISNDKGSNKRSLLKLNTTGANYTEKSIEKYLKEIDAIKEAYENLYDAIRKNYKHILIFTESISDSNKLIDLINQDNKGIIEGQTIIESVSSNTKPKDRERLLDDFRSGKIRVMVNVGVLTTGFDFPELDCLIIARPTMSLALWYQMCGRVVRPSDKKESAVIYDICGNLNHFGNPLELELKKIDGKLWDIYSNGKRITTKNLDEVNLHTEEKLSFGKYKGISLSKVPIGYLQWCVENLSSHDTKAMIKDELTRRNA